MQKAKHPHPDLEAEFDSVGEPVSRVDAKLKVTGRALYLEDMELTGMLYGKMLRSTCAHGKIVSIDTSEAEKVPGVVGVVTGEDLDFLHGESLSDQPYLARGKVRYIGEAVAGVAAVDEATAETARNLIKVVYEPLPTVFDAVKAAKPDAPMVHKDVGTYECAPGITTIPNTNICNHFQLDRGDMEAGFAASDRIFEDTFTTQRQQHCCIEPHGSACMINDDEEVTLWTNNDSPYRCRKELATALGLPLGSVSVVSPPTIGGNFGGKGGLKAEADALALAWKVRNRPIRVMYTRDEEFISLVRHPSEVRIKTGVRADGKILAREVEMYLDTGAYAEKGPTVLRFSGISAAGPYTIPNVKINAYCVYTNNPVSGAMRGYGGPQAAWAYDCQTDLIAREMGIDPVEFRAMQIYDEGDEHITGDPLSSEGIKDCLLEVAKAMDWKNRPRVKDRGIGVACMERAVKTPFGSAAFIKLNEDGTVDILSSTTEVGQGSETILCQIAAEELGVPMEVVRKAQPNTVFTPFDASTTSSRATFHMGNAVRMAAADIKAQLLELAAPLIERDAADLTIRDNLIFPQDDVDAGLTIAEVMKRHYGPSSTVLGRGFYIPKMPEGPAEYYTRAMIFWLLGASGAEVEVDRQTGVVKVLKLWGAFDVGKAINPINCEGQIEGGASMGLGMALSEEVSLLNGQIMNPSFLGYKLPASVDMPEVVSIFVEHPHPDGPFGAKGMGETTNVAVPPAIANAVYDAVGIRIRDLPLTPDKVLAALRQKEKVEARKRTGQDKVTA
jgi:carbon-monoxide dehydrogenase large subunit